MLLSNVSLLNHTEKFDIEVSAELIVSVRPNGEPYGQHDQSICFQSAFAFPGLINSHDHLDFNCFKPLGEKKYLNYRQWGKEIHGLYSGEIEKIIQIPEALRTSWGIYKNLLAGVTTVVNHGKHLNTEHPVIDIEQNTQSLHSIAFEKKWKLKLNNPLLLKTSCTIHTGEGSDISSNAEIDTLCKFNFLKRRITAIHGVAMNELQAKKFAALVWCPESNEVLLGKHAAIEKLKYKTKILFGTDSTLSAGWNIWNHLRLARSLKFATDKELFKMLTSGAAEHWHTNTGKMESGYNADIVIATKNEKENEWDSFFSLNPENILMIVHRGKIRMFDKTILPQLSSLTTELYRFSAVKLNGIEKYVYGNLPDIITKINRFSPETEFPVQLIEAT